jgi:hypothetical protein
MGIERDRPRRCRPSFRAFQCMGAKFPEGAMPHGMAQVEVGLVFTLAFSTTA